MSRKIISTILFVQQRLGQILTAMDEPIADPTAIPLYFSASMPPLKMTMQHSLEMRLPYWDHELVELGMSLPLHYKVRPKETKAVLRSAFTGYLPEDMAAQPKNGFPVPLTS
ncbi:MAG: asparagine synthase-related protein [Desulfosporosinus sp.]|nr:asparagine synthase-related protein [Desulfosporosinus sp.]